MSTDANTTIAKCPEITAQTVAVVPTHHVVILPVTMNMTTTIMKMLKLTNLLDKLLSTVRPQEVPERSTLVMLKRDSSLSNSMRAKRRLNYAETLRCMATASMETPAHTPMGISNSKRRPTFLAIL